MFHDLGLNEQFRGSGRRFEVDSADEARRFLQGHGVPKDSIRRVWTAIALHTTPGVPEFMEPEVALVTAGVEYDVLGIGNHDVSDADRAEITVYRFKNVVTWPDLRVSASRLCRPVILVDHATEDLPALNGPVQRHDD
jgi:hypothetical protein